MPADGVRDVPDVSLFASSSVTGTYFTGGSLFNSFYIVCQQDVLPFGPCSLNSQTMSFLGVGGTSASAPAFAGIMALINQSTGSRQGNANYVFYRLASQQDTAGCNSSNGSGSSCIFNDVTLGSNSVPCKPSTPDCIQTNPSDFYGVFGNYAATPGYDRASGLGSVNIANLVNDWNSAAFNATSTTLTLNPLSSVHGASITATATVTSASGTPTGNVSINGSVVNGSAGEATLVNGVMSKTFYDLPGGTYSVRAHYAGDGAYAASDSPGIGITVTPEDSTEQIETKSYDPWTGETASIGSAPYGTLFLFWADVAGVSGHGTATGSVNLEMDGKPLDGGVFALNGEGIAEDKTIDVFAGQHTITAAYSGDASFHPGSVSHTFTVTPMAMACGVPSSNTLFVRPGWSLYLYGDAGPLSVPGFPFGPRPNGTTVAPTGTISFYAGTTRLAGPIAVTGQGGAILSVIGGIETFRSPGATANALIPASQISNPVPPITATYSGDGNYSGCTSAPLNIAYQTGLLTGAVSAQFANYFAFQVPGSTAATVTVRTPELPIYEPAYPAPTGTVQLLIDGVASGSPVTVAPSNGNASATMTVSTAGLSYGSHHVGFAYSGDSQYSPSQGGDYYFTLSAPDFLLEPPYLNTTVTNGATSAPISLQVIALNGFTGTISFSCTGLPRGATCNFTPGTSTGNGIASLTITTSKALARPAGLRAGLPEPLGGTIAAGIALIFFSRRKRRWISRLMIVLCAALAAATTSCGGAGTTGEGGHQQPGASYITLSATTPTPQEGANDTFTAALTASGTAQPTGTVQFYINNSAAGTPLPLAGSSTTYTTSFPTPGSYSVKAIYSGDLNYLGSSSNPYSVNVSYLSGTAPGTYNVRVIAQSGSLIHTASLVLYVQ